MAIAGGGLRFLTYGIAQAVQTASSGASSSGFSYGPACPSGFGPMIVLMVFGAFLAIGGAAVAGRLPRFLGAPVAAVIVGVVLGFVALNDADTRPGPEILVAGLAPMMLFVVPGIGRTR